MRPAMLRKFEDAAGRSNLLALILDAMLSVIGCGTPKIVGVEMPLPLTLAQSRSPSMPSTTNPCWILAPIVPPIIPAFVLKLVRRTCHPPGLPLAPQSSKWRRDAIAASTWARPHESPRYIRRGIVPWPRPVRQTCTGRRGRLRPRPSPC